MSIRKAISDYLIRRKVAKAFKQSHAYLTIKACTDNNVVISESIADESMYAPYFTTWSKGMAAQMDSRDIVHHRVRDKAIHITFDSTPMAFCGPYLISAAQASSGKWTVRVWNPIDYDDKFLRINDSYGKYEQSGNVGPVIIHILQKLLPDYFKLCTYKARLAGILEIRKGVKVGKS